MNRKPKKVRRAIFDSLKFKTKEKDNIFIKTNSRVQKHNHEYL